MSNEQWTMCNSTKTEREVLNTYRRHLRPNFRAGLCLALLAGVVSSGRATLTNDTFFGFTGPETFPIDPFISDLRAADLDGDGLIDLVVVNNSRSKITLLYNQTGKTNLTRVADPKRELNELPPDA